MKILSIEYTFQHNGSRFFQSYNTIVAKVDQNNGNITLDKNSYDLSKTTAKYRNMFLNMSTSEMKRNIADGTIKLIDLNWDL